VNKLIESKNYPSVNCSLIKHDEKIVTINYDKFTSKKFLRSLGSFFLCSAVITGSSGQALAKDFNVNNINAATQFGKTLVAKGSKLPDYARDAYRNIRLQPANGREYKNDGGRGGTRLPPLRKGEKYIEHDVINPKNTKNRGSYRIVTKVNASNKLVTAYYTGDHYRTFTEIR
jgi:guanyl-specific ribonuclease Sa